VEAALLTADEGSSEFPSQTAKIPHWHNKKKLTEELFLQAKILTPHREV